MSTTLTPGTRVTYCYSPVSGFPASHGAGTIATVCRDGDVLVHPDDTGHDYRLRLYAREVAPAPAHDQPTLF